MCQGPGPRKSSRATAAKAASTCGSPTPAGRRDLLRIDPPDNFQFALAIHLGRISLVRRSGQDSTAFECRVLAANRNPVAGPMPAETMFPLSELDRMLPLPDTALHTAAGSERGRRSSRPSVSSRGTRTILKEPETRRLKNRGHLARNRKFESISLQERVHCELDPPDQGPNP